MNRAWFLLSKCNKTLGSHKRIKTLGGWGDSLFTLQTAQEPSLLCSSLLTQRKEINIVDVKPNHVQNSQCFLRLSEKRRSNHCIFTWLLSLLNPFPIKISVGHTSLIPGLHTEKQDFRELKLNFKAMTAKLRVQFSKWFEPSDAYIKCHCDICAS